MSYFSSPMGLFVSGPLLVAFVLGGCPESELTPPPVEGLTQFPCAQDSDCPATDAAACERFVCEPSVGRCKHEEIPASCDGRVCGPMACGSCGECGAGSLCTPEGQCIADQCGDLTFAGCCTGDGAVRWCNTGNGLVAEAKCVGVCGWAKTIYDCSDFALPSDDISLPYLCPGETCADSCGARECGLACGVSCGTCSAGQTCSAAGTCLECGALGLEGCCDPLGGQYYCQDGVVQGIGCGDSCGWNASANYYECGSEGEDPSGTYQRDCGAAMKSWRSKP